MSDIPVKLKNVLLIDDNHCTNVYNTVIIKRSQIADQVHTIEFPELALEQLQKASKQDMRTGLGQMAMPELIFLDVNMPRMSGWEFLVEFEKINNTSNSKSILFMLTAALHPKLDDRYNAFSFMKGILQKPLTVDLLHNIIKEHFVENGSSRVAY